jgi:multidrug efflux pump subunit AcrA (membrane-fusion protein)
MNTLLKARHRHGAEVGAWPLAACTVLSACTCTQVQPKAEAPSDNGERPAAAIMRHAGAASIPSASPFRKSLQVAAADEHTVERPTLLPCAIEAAPARLINVVCPVSRRIVAPRKMLGDAAKKSDAFFAIDSANLAEATSGATSGTTKARAALAQRNLQRQTKLAQAEIVARKALERAEGNVDNDAPTAPVSDLLRWWRARTRGTWDRRSSARPRGDFVRIKIRKCAAPLATSRHQGHAKLGSA